MQKLFPSDAVKICLPTACCSVSENFPTRRRATKPLRGNCPGSHWNAFWRVRRLSHSLRTCSKTTQFVYWHEHDRNGSQLVSCMLKHQYAAGKRLAAGCTCIRDTAPELSRRASGRLVSFFREENYWNLALLTQALQYIAHYMWCNQKGGIHRLDIGSHLLLWYPQFFLGTDKILCAQGQAGRHLGRCAAIHCSSAFCPAHRKLLQPRHQMPPLQFNYLPQGLDLICRLLILQCGSLWRWQAYLLTIWDGDTEGLKQDCKSSYAWGMILYVEHLCLYHD